MCSLLPCGSAAQLYLHLMVLEASLSGWTVLSLWLTSSHGNRRPYQQIFGGMPYFEPHAMSATIRASVVYPDFVRLYGSAARHAVPDHALSRFLCFQVFQHFNNPPQPQAGDAGADIWRDLLG